MTDTTTTPTRQAVDLRPGDRISADTGPATVESITITRSTVRLELSTHRHPHTRVIAEYAAGDTIRSAPDYSHLSPAELNALATRETATYGAAIVPGAPVIPAEQRRRAAATPTVAR